MLDGARTRVRTGGVHILPCGVTLGVSQFTSAPPFPHLDMEIMSASKSWGSSEAGMSPYAKYPAVAETQ